MRHKAVRKARQDLGLSQKKLAELAGVQRRQLSTLEEGGNITPRHSAEDPGPASQPETFTFDAVTATVRRQVSQEEKQRAVDSAVELLAKALHDMVLRDDRGLMAQDEDVKALQNASAVWSRPPDIADQPGPHLVEEPQPAASRGDAASAFASTLALARRRRNRARGAKATGENG